MTRQQATHYYYCQQQPEKFRLGRDGKAPSKEAAGVVVGAGGDKVGYNSIFTSLLRTTTL